MHWVNKYHTNSSLTALSGTMESQWKKGVKSKWAKHSRRSSQRAFPFQIMLFVFTHEDWHYSIMYNWGVVLKCFTVLAKYHCSLFWLLMASIIYQIQLAAVYYKARSSTQWNWNSAVCLGHPIRKADRYDFVCQKDLWSRVGFQSRSVVLCLIFHGCFQLPQYLSMY